MFFIMELTILICVHSKDRLKDALLKAALNNLLIQTYQDFSVVIVYDECWGWTREKVFEPIIKLMRDHCFCVVHKEEKTGLADAKNFGLQWVETEWVGFLDADDEYTPDKLEKQVNFLKEHKEVDILSTHYWWRDIVSLDIIGNYKVSPLRNSCFQTDQYITHEEIVKRLPEENVLCHGSIMMRTSIFDKLKYDNSKEWLGKEDWKLWLDCMKAGYKFYQIPERLYVYTRNPNPVR